LLFDVSEISGWFNVILYCNKDISRMNEDNRVNPVVNLIIFSWSSALMYLPTNIIIGNAAGPSLKMTQFLGKLKRTPMLPW
jgi:hypothetical protein